MLLLLLLLPVLVPAVTSFGRSLHPPPQTAPSFLKSFFFNTLFNSLLSFEYSSSLHSASFMFLIKMKSCRASQPDFNSSPRFFVFYFRSRQIMCFFEPIRKIYPVTCPSVRLLVGWQTRWNFVLSSKPWSKPAYYIRLFEHSNYARKGVISVSALDRNMHLQHAKWTDPRHVVYRSLATVASFERQKLRAPTARTKATWSG